MQILAISLLIVLGQATSAVAQYQLESWTADEGLPQNIITGLHQTSDGYLWIATLDGLARFDGVRFTVFNKANSPGIESNRFTALYADQQGHLWLGTETGAVTQYTRDRFVTYTKAHGLPPAFIRGFTGDGTGRLWVLAGDTIMQWEPSGQRFVHTDAPQVANGYRTPAWSDRGGFWGVDRAGLRRFVGGVWELHTLPPPFLTETAVFGEEQDGTIWVSTPDGQYTRIEKDGPVRFQSGTRVPSDARSRRHPAPQLQWHARSGKSWSIEVGPGLHRSLTLTSSAGRETVAATTLYEDSDGNLWVGTDGDGLYQVRKHPITVYSQTQGLVGRNVYPVLQGRDGVIWIGVWPGGLSRFQSGVFTNYTVRDGLAPGGVTALHEDESGRLWVATQHGLRTFEGGRLTSVAPDLLPAGATIRVIHQDRAGAMWFGTDHGLVRLVDGATTLFTARDGLATDDVRVIVEASASKGLWIGGYGGLTLLRDGEFTAWTEAHGLPGSTLRALYEDSGGVLWIGTYDTGLVRFHDGRFTHYTTREGLFNDGVFQILEDGRANLWMSSNRGIFRVSKRDLEDVAAGRSREINSVAYGTSDGMLNVECNGGLWPAGTKARDGTLWFPTQDGVAVIDPASLTTNLRPPSVLIESFLLDRQPVAPSSFDRPLRIGPGRSAVEIAYTGLSFTHPERVRFRYRLAGLDENWVDAGPRRTAYYSHIPPGRYTFTVIAANRDGIWNTEGSSLQLDVLPPFYLTWWFLTLTMAGTAALVVAIWKRRESRLKLAQAVQQAFSRQLIASQEVERKRIAAELHDGLGQRLVIIKNLAVLVNSATTDGIRGRVDEISAEASQAIGEVREIAYNLRPHHLERLGLTKTLESLVRRAASASSIAFTADIDNVDRLFPKDAEINVYRVVQESVNNVLKHAGATRALVTARRTPSEVVITVRDNGRGFVPATGEPQVGRDGFGLTGMTERASLLGGRVEVRSAPAEGTTIRILFNIRKLASTSASSRASEFTSSGDDCHAQ